METKVFKIDQDENLIEIDQVVKILHEGGIVAIPTETVYGLGGDGLNPKSIEKIFRAKNRPMDNPLILHISEIDQMFNLGKNIKEDHIEILKKLWPGPLTVVVERQDIVPDEVTGGLETVAIRMPNKKITRQIISKLGRPLAAPSANISSKPSPTNAHDVLQDMEGVIDAIIDGGPSQIGIESTVLDLTEPVVKILRPGYYTKEMLEKYFGQVDMDLALKDEKQKPKSPGQKYKHYSPNAEVQVLVGSDQEFRAEVQKILDLNKKLGLDRKIGLMVFDTDLDFFLGENVVGMGSKEDLSEMARNLFATFRKMDDNSVELIIVRGVEEEGFGLSIMNRLKKAAGNRVRRI